MLVNAADESVDVLFRRAFISIADLTYLDKQVLERIYSPSLNVNSNALSLSGLATELVVLDLQLTERKRLDRLIFR